jgi:hypothetical protein
MEQKQPRKACTLAALIYGHEQYWFRDIRLQPMIGLAGKPLLAL